MRLIDRVPVVSMALLLLGVAACGSAPIASEPSAAESNPTSSAAEKPTTTTQAPSDTTTSSAETTGATDRADDYLGATTEIYRRTLPDGHDFVVRLSTESYATVFGLTWTAPTGSAERCLGDHAVFLGVPGDIGPWGSAWVANPWFDESSSTQPAELQSSMSAAEPTVPATEYLLVRTGTAAAEIVLSSSDGTELDRARVANGVAMVVVDPLAKGEGSTVNDLSVTVIPANGQPSAPSPLAPTEWGAPSDCGPGDAPQRPLPAAGVQPADPGNATAQIRQRHALLVDRSISHGRQLGDLLDDDTGVQSAIAQMDTGPYADIAATATYSIDEVVFTQPEEAWFRYTITTSASTYGDRFGRAVFNGTVWQITRATICQDLALAQSPCDPTPPTVEPPSTPEWDTAWQEWVSRAMLYTGNDGCPPLSQC